MMNISIITIRKKIIVEKGTWYFLLIFPKIVDLESTRLRETMVEIRLPQDNCLL